MVRKFIIVISMITNMLSANIDINDNGMSDVWERLYGAETLLPHLDVDLDGQTAMEESLAGTDPFQATSVFELNSTDEYSSAIIVKWASKVGVLYQLEQSNNLSGPWNAVGGEVEGNGGDLVVILDQLGNASSYFKVEILGFHGYDGLPSEASSLMGSHDTDGDGISDFAEIKAGLNPLDASVSLPALSVSVGSGFKVTWNSVKGKRYRIQTSSGTGGLWLDEGVPHPGSGGVMSTSVGFKQGESKNVRVTVEDVDTDGDGLNDWEELQLGLNPEMKKTDAMGLGDYLEGGNMLDSSSVIAVQASKAVANLSRMEEGGFEILRKGGVDELTVSYSISGTAIAGSDYIALSGTVTIPFGVESVVLPVTPVLGSSISLSESVILTLQSSGSYVLGADTAQQVNVIKEVAISVTDHGAVGDGVADDTDAIQAAIDALENSANHNTLFFPSGTYRLNTKKWLDANTGTSNWHLLALGVTDLSNRDINIVGVGNAVLYSTISPIRAHMLVAHGKFRSLQVRGMRLEKDSVPLTQVTAAEPNGSDGVSLIKHDGRVIEFVEFSHCSFVNCHGAFFAYGGGYDHRGRLKQLKVYNCQISNPYGSNTVNSNQSWGGGQQCKMSAWVGFADYRYNRFEGGGEDMTDSATSPGGRLKDGGHFGSPLRLRFRDNTVLRMGVEALHQTNDPTLMGGLAKPFVIPPANGVTQGVMCVNSVNSTYTPGEWINLRIPFNPGLDTANTILKVVGFDRLAKEVTVVNYPQHDNPDGGEIIPKSSPIYLTNQYQPTEAHIRGNYFNGVVPPGGNKGIQLDCAIAFSSKAVVENNILVGHAVGMLILEETHTPLHPSQQGGVIKHNYFLTRDPDIATTYVYGIQDMSDCTSIIGNHISTVVSRKFCGILCRGNNTKVSGNYVIPMLSYKVGTSSYIRSVGIAVGFDSEGVIMRSNCTYGHDMGTGPLQPFMSRPHEVHGHHSLNETVPSHSSGLNH